ncbi:hypothetical protein AKJ09_06054 [Labilithrix luteola]|uniref:Uncharacterized protein n=1 Tax=Labilithrix luteola TaxID=1391654 RepID=A0A0K1Q0S8_9BACT|nr:hypothetical protein [Labilithrix luteola]AKU99390.1 hypothetical protein AKJ09_06054 [Labilithrix luteola]
MPHAALALLLVLLVRGLNGRSKAGSLKGTMLTWGVLVCIWGIATFVSSLPFFDPPAGKHPPEVLLRALAQTTLLGVVGGGFLFFPWPLLVRLARLGRPKLVYVLAHLCLLFASSAETRAGACLLAGLALAYRGNATKAERDWLLSRLQTDDRLLGTHATAFALYLALESRAQKDEGNAEASFAWAEQSRLVLGTVTYFSSAAVPAGVRRQAYELLSLFEASRGQWGGIMGSPLESLGPTAHALRDWADEQFSPPPGAGTPPVKRKRPRKPNGVAQFDALFARTRDEAESYSAAEAYAMACGIHRELLRGGPVGPRRAVVMLSIYDVLLHPECPDTMLPEDVRKDEALLESVYDDIADSIAKSLVHHPAPLFMLTQPGIVSARVYQRLESALTNELTSALTALGERHKRGVRTSLHEELLETSRVRGIYRRFEQCFGPQAVAQYLPSLVEGYGNFGVSLSETLPRRRPLAYALFNVLHGEARRFQHADYITLYWKNMNVTSAID